MEHHVSPLSSTAHQDQLGMVMAVHHLLSLVQQVLSGMVSLATLQELIAQQDSHGMVQLVSTMDNLLMSVTVGSHGMDSVVYKIL